MLHRTGGIAGLVTRYRLNGEYDFDRGGVDSRMASFENAEVWGSSISDGPLPFSHVIDVDEILNLEGLKGTQLPVAGPFDVYRFNGLTADESTIELFATLIGPWMYLRGGTDPPPGSADFFEYQIRALARRGRSADLNENGVVDAADYVLARDTSGLAGNDVARGATLADWQEQFGETIPDLTEMDAAIGAAAASFLTAAATPEPSTLTLLILAAAMISKVVQRVRRR
jgi:hypothetical protein